MDSDKLLKVIKKIVREEVRSVLSRASLNEAVESEVNRILAEKFVSSISLNESRPTREPQKQTQKEPSQKIITEERKRDLLRKLGIENSPASEIFEGVEAPGSEEDDEGIDLSQFGLRTK